MNQDLENLRLLSIFHYVVAGLVALCSLFPLFYFGLGLAMMSGMLDTASSPPDEGAKVVGGIFVGFAGFFILLGLTFAGLVVRAGRKLAAHRSHTYCMVIAGLLCLFMPFGTVLGVFTIVILTRDSVRMLFDPPAERPEAPLAS